MDCFFLSVPAPALFHCGCEEKRKGAGVSPPFDGKTLQLVTPPAPQQKHLQGNLHLLPQNEKGPNDDEPTISRAKKIPSTMTKKYPHTRRAPPPSALWPRADCLMMTFNIKTLNIFIYSAREQLFSSHCLILRMNGAIIAVKATYSDVSTEPSSPSSPRSEEGGYFYRRVGC